MQVLNTYYLLCSIFIPASKLYSQLKQLGGTRNHSIIKSTNQPQLDTVETMIRHQILITFLKNEIRTVKVSDHLSIEVR